MENLKKKKDKKAKKKANKLTVQKSETKKEDIPDPTDVSDSETEDDEELDSPREGARAVRFADPTIERKKVAYTD